MSLPESYQELQEACGINVDDTVRVLRKVASHALGWGVGWADGMDSFVGKVGRVTRTHRSYGVKVLFPNGVDFNFPFFVLEKVEGELHTICVDGGGTFELSHGKFLRLLDFVNNHE